MKLSSVHLSSFALLLSLAFCAGNAHAFGGRDDTTGGSYDSSGGNQTTQERAGSSCTLYRPSNLDGNHPVILWGNGTGASPSSYRGLLRHWASWGFVVLAANTTNAGTGRDMLECLDWLEDSSISGYINFNKVGTSGHSQGGGGSIMAATDDRIATSAPIEGYTLGLGHDRRSHTNQSGPMLLLSGSADTLVNPTRNHAGLFSRTNVPVFWAILQGASHFEPVGDGGDFRGITTAWFLYQLFDDADAATEFEGSNCGYCNTSRWEVEQKSL